MILFYLHLSKFSFYFSTIRIILTYRLTRTLQIKLIISGTKGQIQLCSRNGPVEWPPLSCDLTPLDICLRGHIKSLVYANKPATLDDLKDNIQREIANVPVEMCARVVENRVQRMLGSASK